MILINSLLFLTKACAILACQTAEIATCGVRNESLAFAHTFDKIEITGTFPGGDQFFYLPTTLDQSIMPLDVNAFSYQKIERYQILQKNV